MKDVVGTPGLARRWVLILALLLVPLYLRGEPARDLDDWKYETIRLANGKVYRGLVREETPEVVKFWEVKRPTGEPARRMWHVFPRAAVEHIDRLGPQDREQLWRRIRALDPTARARDERNRLQELVLETIPWGKDGKRKGLGYTSVYFELKADAREDIVRRVALRLEQIYAAYAQRLPPRRPLTATRQTTILLVDSWPKYQELVKQQGGRILNPALYDPARNLILCGSDLQRIGADLERVRRDEEAWEKQLRHLKKHYKGRLPAALLGQVKRDREEMRRVRDLNDQVFRTATARLFQTLYHEAFHAYLESFVYPAAEATVPPWLNEGLAQIFETALLDAGELRVGHVDDKRLAHVKDLLRKGQLVPLAELLRAGPPKFHLVHASDRQLVDRYYLTSWALAYYLLFDQALFQKTGKLDEYVFSLKRGADPLAAFQKLVGKPPPQFENDFHGFLQRLEPPKKK